jgi:hydroxymethylbilane synthase
MQKQFVIGTRGSLLAVTQCELIRDEIQNKTGAKFNLKKITTQGDQRTDKPLWQLEGKDFFTKELDAELLAKKIDLVVHSYKDLGSDRPEGIQLASITKREYAHDILLIKEDTIAKIQNRDQLIIGTSSPRRIVNIESTLKEYLPYQKAAIHCKTLRGNVNTRIQKLRDGEFDAIVLAYAGLERLASSTESKKTLESLLEGINFMVLPQKAFPSSASQGALAIELANTRDDDLVKILKTVECKDTIAEISRERKAFATYGGGCHLAVGIHVKKIHNYFVHIQKGKVDDQSIYKLELEGYDYSQLKDLKVYYMYGENDFLLKKEPISTTESNHQTNIFVTSSYCFHNINDAKTLWSAGTRTMRKLAQKGFWVNGSAEGFGHEELYKFQKSNLMQIFLKKTNSWKVLSHDKASSPLGEVIASYSHQITPDMTDLNHEIFQTDIIFWNSFIQYETYLKHYPQLKNKKHACGLGKTLKKFQNEGIDVIPVIDMNHLKNLLK